jgi:hypothetical protein
MKYYKVNFQGIKANFYVNAKNEVCAVYRAIEKFNIEPTSAVVGMVTEV